MSLPDRLREYLDVGAGILGAIVAAPTIGVFVSEPFKPLIDTAVGFAGFVLVTGAMNVVFRKVRVRITWLDVDTGDVLDSTPIITTPKKRHLLKIYEISVTAEARSAVARRALKLAARHTLDVRVKALSDHVAVSRGSHNVARHAPNEVGLPLTGGAGADWGRGRIEVEELTHLVKQDVTVSYKIVVDGGTNKPWWGKYMHVESAVNEMRLRSRR